MLALTPAPRVPVQATEGEVQDSDLPLQRELTGGHLPGHPKGQVVASPLHLQGAPLHLQPPQRLQPLRPPRLLHRHPVPAEQGGA